MSRLKDALESHEVLPVDNKYNIQDEDFSSYISELVWSARREDLSLHGTPVTVVDSYGGEGQGDEYWVVFKCEDEYVEVSGYYSSWDGGEYNTLKNVLPEEQITIKWVSA